MEYTKHTRDCLKKYSDKLFEKLTLFEEFYRDFTKEIESFEMKRISKEELVEYLCDLKVNNYYKGLKEDIFECGEDPSCECEY